MFVKKLVIACVIISCANKFQATPRTKFSFSKTFVTPKKTYEQRLAELDKYEVLERSNFSSDEDDAEDLPVRPHAKRNDLTSVANARAQVFVRIGENRDRRSPALQERFIEVPDRQEWYLSPDHVPSAAFYPHVAPCYNFGPNIFPACHCAFPPPYIPGASEKSDPKNEQNAQTKESVTKNPSVVYFFKRDKDGRIPTREEMKRTTTGELTLDDLDFIEEITGDDVDEEYETECPEVTETFINDDEATQTNALYESEPEETMTSADEEQSTTPSPLSLSQPYLPPDPRYYLDENDILICEITPAPPCHENSKNCSCIEISDNLIFVKINISDLVDYNVSRREELEEVCTNTIYDVDDLMYHTVPCSLPASSLYPSWSHKKFLLSLYAPYFKPWSPCNYYNDKTTPPTPLNDPPSIDKDDP